MFDKIIITKSFLWVVIMNFLSSVNNSEVSSYIPYPKQGIFTDIQKQQILTIVPTVILVVATIVAIVAASILCPWFLFPVGIISPFLIVIPGSLIPPSMDFQSERGAKEIWKDLTESSFETIRYKYYEGTNPLHKERSQLVYYKFVTQQEKNDLEKLVKDRLDLSRLRTQRDNIQKFHESEFSEDCSVKNAAKLIDTSIGYIDESIGARQKNIDLRGNRLRTMWKQRSTGRLP